VNAETAARFAELDAPSAEPRETATGCESADPEFMI